MTALCWACKRRCEVAYTDQVDRPFCASCSAGNPEQTQTLLAFLAATVPYREGDLVSCRTAGQVYDGVGRVAKVSFDPADLASPVVPMFLVQMETKAYPEVPDQVWYSEVCLSSTSEVGSDL